MKKFALIFLACFFLSLHYGAILYTNSSLLGSFFPSEIVSSLFFLGALGNIALFFFIPGLIRRFGNRALLLTFLAVAGLGTFCLAVSSSGLLVAAAFVVYTSVLYPVFYCLDLFLEDLSRDTVTGEIRGAWLALIHIGLISGLVVLSVFSVADVLKPVYLAAAFILIPTFLVALSFDSENIVPRSRRGFTLPFKLWWHTKSIRRITLSRFSLEFFYAFMTIYTPLYLHAVLGFDWTAIGVMFAIALLPFVLLQWPAGRLADIFYGEKEMLIIGFLFMGGSVLFMPSLGTGVVLWTLVLFFSRIGACLVETMTDSYFFKHVDASDAGLLSIFRLTRPVSVALGAATGALALSLISFEKIFYIIAIVAFFGIKEALLLRDTK